MRRMRQLGRPDRVGISWRPEFAAGILAHLEEIDVVEVLIEPHLSTSRRQRQALQFLVRQVPVVFHGVSLGLASSFAVEARRLDAIARFLDSLRAEAWSEHFAFVRAGGIEIGHLAAPPRAEWSVDATLQNLHRLVRTVGRMPALENVATLIEPPGSTLGESQWIGAIVRQSAAPLLLDLHNLACNACNGGLDVTQLLAHWPLEAVTTLHLSGGRLIGEPARYARHVGAQRMLDDHRHDVSPAVLGLLAQVRARVVQPLDVIIERDGNFPAFEQMRAQLRAARAALRAGRALPAPPAPAGAHHREVSDELAVV
jgi:uncharacterized protein (UPF0276 family)